MDKRRSGILLHITSLPSSCGVGDLGPEAYRFADFLERTRQSYWQVLPLNPTNRPSIAHGNWEWRLLTAQMTPSVLERLLEVTETFGRT